MVTTILDFKELKSDLRSHVRVLMGRPGELQNPSGQNANHPRAPD
jgi:hypothetical protein